MPIHNYTVSDREALVDLAAFQNGWNGSERLGRETFSHVLGQPGLEPESNCFLLEESGALQGYSLVFPEVEIRRAVIELGASNESQERSLFETAIDRANELHNGVAHLCIMEGSPRANTAAAYGFTKVQTYFEMVWDHKSLPEVPLPDGFWTRSFEDGDAALLTRVQNEAFSGSWGFCPNTVEQIDYRTRAPITSPANIIFLFDGETPAGYCWTVLHPVDSGIRGIIGMIGVVPQYRGRQVSRSILYSGMSYLRTLDICDIGLEVDGSNTPAVGLYTSTGFEKVAERYWFELRLAGTPPVER